MQHRKKHTKPMVRVIEADSKAQLANTQKQIDVLYRKVRCVLTCDESPGMMLLVFSKEHEPQMQQAVCLFEQTYGGQLDRGNIYLADQGEATVKFWLPGQIEAYNAAGEKAIYPSLEARWLAQHIDQGHIPHAHTATLAECNEELIKQVRDTARLHEGGQYLFN